MKDCIICKHSYEDFTKLKEINICAVRYYFCETCYKKIYYHFRDVIQNKIKHP